MNELIIDNAISGITEFRWISIEYIWERDMMYNFREIYKIAFLKKVPASVPRYINFSVIMS
jgi:hypothetical protein